MAGTELGFNTLLGTDQIEVIEMHSKQIRDLKQVYFAWKQTNVIKNTNNLWKLSELRIIKDKILLRYNSNEHNGVMTI